MTLAIAAMTLIGSEDNVRAMVYRNQRCGSCTTSMQATNGAFRASSSLQDNQDFESLRRLGAIKSLVSRGRGALTARGTRRESIPGGSVAASMP
ncbi:hypothetical protein ABQY63_18815, partial [Xanthomonas hortorum pv. pelargonii]